MPLFLDTRGHSTLGIGICARCSRKFPLDELYSDPNNPGLKVCIDDLDEFDPYRLPARQPDRISLPFTRPDVDLTGTAPGVATVLDTVYITQDTQFLVTEAGVELEPEGLTL